MLTLLVSSGSEVECPAAHHGTRKCLDPRLEVGAPARQFAAARHGPDRRLRIDSSVDAAAAVEAALRVGVVEIMHDARHLHALVLVELMLEHRVRRRALVEHEVLAHHPAGVRQPLGKAVAGGIEQQTHRLRAVRGQDHRPRFLEMLAFVAVEIMHAGGAAARIGIHVVNIALRPHLAAPRRLGFRNHGVQRGRLRPRLAAEAHAEAAVHARRAAAKRLRRDGHGRRERSAAPTFARRARAARRKISPAAAAWDRAWCAADRTDWRRRGPTLRLPTRPWCSTAPVPDS